MVFVIQFFLCLVATSLMADWGGSTVIYTTSPDNAVMPSIVVDASDNLIAVWVDTTDTGSMQAATLGLGEEEYTWVLTNPVYTGDVSPPTNPDTQAVGIDGSGNAIAVWTDGTNLYSATLTSGSSTWSSATLIATTTGEYQTIVNPSIAVAANGNAVVSWLDRIHPYEGPMYASVFSSGSWSTPKMLHSDDTQFNDYTTPLSAIDAIGNAVVATCTDPGYGSQVFSYDVGSQEWTNIPTELSSPPVYTQLAMNSAGAALVVWTQEDETILAVTLPLNAGAFSSVTQLSSNVDITDSGPAVTIDSSGNGLAVWTDASGNLASATYSEAGSTWSVNALLDLGGETASTISLAGNGDGNGAASWTVYSDENSYIQAALFSADGSAWGAVTGLSPTSGTADNSRVSVTPNGNVVALWQNDAAGTIESNINLSFYGPEPPNTFVGTVVLNRFLTQTDRVHQLNWTASLDSSTVSYKLTRNGAALATFSAGSSAYVYDDHNRIPGVKDTYTIGSVNEEGLEGETLSVILR